MTAPDQGCPTFPTGWPTQLPPAAAKGGTQWCVPWEDPDVLHRQSTYDLLPLHSAFPGAPQRRAESRLLTGGITPTVAIHF